MKKKIILCAIISAVVMPISMFAAEAPIYRSTNATYEGQAPQATNGTLQIQAVLAGKNKDTLQSDLNMVNHSSSQLSDQEVKLVSHIEEDGFNKKLHKAPTWMKKSLTEKQPSTFMLKMKGHFPS